MSIPAVRMAAVAAVSDRSCLSQQCGWLLWLLVLLVGLCRLGCADRRLNNEIEVRSTRRLCGHAFDKMYFTDACDMLGKKRSVWPALWPSAPQFRLATPSSGETGSRPHTPAQRNWWKAQGLNFSDAAKWVLESGNVWSLPVCKVVLCYTKARAA